MTKPQSNKPKLYTDFYTNARQYGKKTMADKMTQMALAKMEVGQTFMLASITGNKYFQCIEPPKKKLEIFYEEAEDISHEKS